MLDMTKANKPNNDRIKFEQTDSTNCVVENEYFKIYNDTKSGKTFKVINDEVVPIELRELNMWKNRQKNPMNFTVDIISDDKGNVYDYVISRSSANADTTASPMIKSAPIPPLATSSPAQTAVTRPSATQPTAAPAVKTVMTNAPEISRVKFEMTDTTTLVIENEYFKIYNDTKAPKPFKVINDEVAPIELKELNMWKNRQKNPQNFTVEIITDKNGGVYDYAISRATADASVATSTSPVAQTAPVQAVANTKPAAAPVQPIANTKPVAAPVQPTVNTKPVVAPSAVVISTTDTADVTRVKFEMTDTTTLVIENEYFKIYNDTKAGRPFKVINDEIVPIDTVKELNMWKNRQKNPQNFTVEIIKDKNGNIFDYAISRGTSNGEESATPVTATANITKTTATSATSATTVTTTAPVVPARTPAVAKGTSAVTTTINKDAVADRIKFEETETTICVVENEFCKIYRDSKAGRTFKVINGMIAPIPQKEVNMWKNRQKNPQNFSIEIVKDASGADFDYVITKTGSTVVDTSATITEGAVKRAPITEPAKSESKSKNRKPKSTRLCKCAICGSEYNDADLFLFGNRNFCLNCVEDCVKEKVQGFPIDPVEKAILDVTTADEIYCTYSTITDYPYLDENFCVNVCTVSRAAESVDENTTVVTIDDKGTFFDDLKRFGLKKIIVNNDDSHIFSPHDFDEHIKTECVLAPKLYFKILNFLQNNDEELREKIAPVFLGSKLYTFSLTDDIVEINEDNLEEFKPLTISDGYVNFCPVFTDVTEARNIGLPFKGLYEIDANLIPDDGITHYIVNPASVAFIINRTTLEGVEPKFETEEPTVAEETATEVVADVVADEETVAEAVAEDVVVADEPVVEAVTEDVTAVDETVDEVVAEGDVAVTETVDEVVTEDVAEPVDEDVAEDVANDILYFEKESPLVENSISNTSTDETTANNSALEIDENNDFTTSLDLSNLMLDEESEEQEEARASIQQQITETKVIAADLENESNFSVAQILREKLDESYRNLAKLIASADKMYAQFDENTKHILIDGFNRGHIFSEKSIAEKSIEAFKNTGFDVYVKEYSNDELFTMLYEYKRHGIQDLVLDETANWIVISTDTIADMLNVSVSEYVSIPVTNPELMFSMTTLFQKLQAKSDNPNRKAELVSCERRMIREFTSARYILPLLSSDMDNMQPVIVENKQGVKRVLVFSDVFEMKRFFGKKYDIVKDYKIISYTEMMREFADQENTVVVLNEGSLRFEFNQHNREHIDKVIN